MNAMSRSRSFAAEPGWRAGPVLTTLAVMCQLALGGCTSLLGSTATPLGNRTPLQTLGEQPALQADMAARARAPAKVQAVPAPASTATPAPPAPTPTGDAAGEPRFDLIVNGAPARDVFLAMAADQRVNILTHPELSGNISVTLRRVTLREALEAIRDVYGYDFKMDGRRITIYPPTMQSRVFVVNYLHSKRDGRSDVRVSSGSAPANSANANTGGGAPGQAQALPESSQISTTSHNDLWAELGEALRGMIGTAGGRSVILSPQSGMIAVRAMPDELRQVEALLNAARVAIERQVMLDVKIVSVELREGFQSGIDWSLLRGHGTAGMLSGGTSNTLLSNTAGHPTIPPGVNLLNDNVPLPTPGTGLFGLSLAAQGFQSVLGFLETHGEVQTLSSPRLATLNNQKAVLKVGTDDYFVTNISGGTVASGGSNAVGTTTLPTLSLTPFFSGIALDVTPQIDEGNMITLHVHPSVSAVTERNKQVDLGALGSYKLPLASSSINETDTMVRIPDGQIVAIGGLMQMETNRAESGLPGSNATALTATLMGNRVNSSRKKELIVLIKPTIIRSSDDWQQQTRAAWDELGNTGGAPVRTIRLDGPAQPTQPAVAAPAPLPAKPATPIAAAAEPTPVPAAPAAVLAAGGQAAPAAPPQGPRAKAKRAEARRLQAERAAAARKAPTGQPSLLPATWATPATATPMRLRLAEWPA
ncbi:MAG: secretin N-terminal domain-containing protein [Vitreoscilla sp.]|nr:secretin N-terminal domain-containing protein [Burkholderiales bacterium]MBP6336282.1 secretin N-terminal domain-containing protein [Vitreoscilla sp.]MBP6674594.1 secretin N-terminal domain-containing protein [Vitreoscilla sp.]